MAHVIFYEKPGCSGNTKQKKRLIASGHTVEARDILCQDWTPARLRPFFGVLPLVQWFNASAPPIRDGRLLPQCLSEAEALSYMCANPLLIRRPLMEVGGTFRCGFDEIIIGIWIGLSPAPPVADGCDRHDGRPCVQLEKRITRQSPAKP